MKKTWFVDKEQHGFERKDRYYICLITGKDCTPYLWMGSEHEIIGTITGKQRLRSLANAILKELDK